MNIGCNLSEEMLEIMRTYPDMSKDPAFRCKECRTIVLSETIQRLKMCPECGSRQFGNVLSFKDKELEPFGGKEAFPKEWIALFEPIANDDGSPL